MVADAYRPASRAGGGAGPGTAHGARPGGGPLRGRRRRADALCQFAHPPERGRARRHPAHPASWRTAGRAWRAPTAWTTRASPRPWHGPPSSVAGRHRTRIPRRWPRPRPEPATASWASLPPPPGRAGAARGRRTRRDRRGAGGTPGCQRRLLDRLSTIAIANTQWVAVCHTSTQAKLLTVMTGDDARRAMRRRVGTDSAPSTPPPWATRRPTRRPAVRRRHGPGAGCLRRHPGGVRGPDHPRIPVVRRLLGPGGRGGPLVHGPRQPGHGRQRQHLGRRDRSDRPAVGGRLRGGRQAAGRPGDRWRRHCGRARHRHGATGGRRVHRPRPAGAEHVRTHGLEPVHGARLQLQGGDAVVDRARDLGHSLPLREHRPSAQGRC